MYVKIWHPGPPHRPSPSPPEPGKPWFYDSFEDTSQWTEHVYMDGKIAIVDGKLKLYYVTSAGYGNAGIRRTDARAWPENWTWSFKFKHHDGLKNFSTYCNTGATRVRMRFKPPNKIGFIEEAGYTEISVDNYVGLTHVWKVIVTGMTAELWRDDTLIRDNLQLQIYTSYPGKCDHWNEGNTTTYTDEYEIIED